MTESNNFQLNPKLATLSFTHPISLDLETTGLRAWEDDIRLIAITDAENNSYVIEPHKYSNHELQSFIGGLAKCPLIVNQNIKFDIGFIYYHYKVLLRNLHCTMVAQQILENGWQTKYQYDLVSILGRTLMVDHALSKEKASLQKSFTNKNLMSVIDDVPTLKHKQYEYAVEDTIHLLRLAKWQQDRLSDNKLSKIYKLEMKLLPVLAKMEVEGCLINKDLWSSLVNDFWKKDQRTIEQQLDKEALNLITARYKKKKIKFKYKFNRTYATIEQFDMFGSPHVQSVEDELLFNHASQSQIIELFEYLGEKPPMSKAWTDRKGNYHPESPTVDEGSIQVYLTEHGDTKLSVFLEILLEYRQITKLLSTYGESFLERLDRNNCIHTSYTQTRTTTGRLSSVSPNLQNIPKAPKGQESRDIRQCFRARPGYKFITCDMSSAEIRIAADYSGDKLLIDAMINGADMHSKLASISYSIIFGQPVDINNTNDELVVGEHHFVKSELRSTHKSVVFAKFYKGGAARVYDVLSKYINLFHSSGAKRKEIAQLISNALEKELPKLSLYLDTLIDRARTNGYLVGSILGRRRYFERDVYGDASNMPIQNTNAEAMKMALIRIDKLITEGNYDARIVMNIHDEVVVEVKAESAEYLAPIIQAIVAQSLQYFLKIVPGAASVEIADYWKK